MLDYLRLENRLRFGDQLVQSFEEIPEGIILGESGEVLFEDRTNISGLEVGDEPLPVSGQELLLSLDHV